ncbi:GABA transporter 1-like [Andrographis paniculata]|uniref:GABA transporter 1-like n=1 Tax=Andrographis paniculata TaxID=175694 RepID=UPI0021E75365|nr:GABA transporter 1-like [Andrographis paniculata]
MASNGEEKHGGAPAAAAGEQKELDAGAQFVLKSRGSWVHCGYHLTTSIVAPSLLSLPFAVASLGWTVGICSLLIGAAVTFYGYNLLSLVLEHHAQLGNRHLRFRDMATTILGPKWGRYYVGAIQFLVCYGTVVGFILLGGQCMKAIYTLSKPDVEMKLYDFVIIFGGLMLVLAQIPSFHSLRHINMVSLLLCLSYSACATAASIYIGISSKGPKKDYSLDSNTEKRVFGIFNALAIIGTTFGNGIIPEIQATLAPPVKGKMFKGLCVCYAVLMATFFSVSISGYWAFGNRAEGLILTNFLNGDDPLVPKWFILMTNVLTILQLSAVAVVYLQPTNEVLERTFADPKSREFSSRNVVPRVISRSISVVVATTLAAMLPFFGDINALIGAFGFIPLDFVLPFVFFVLTFEQNGIKRYVHISLAVIFSALGIIAAVAAVRQIIIDAKTYQLFANI